MENQISRIRSILERFQAGYSARNLANLDEFMELFAPKHDIELIGIGASTRGGDEWFEGQGQIREIIEGDWKYWGDVYIDVEGARINVLGDVAWISTSGTLTQTDTFDSALPQYFEQMKAFLDDEAKDLDTRLTEATHYGMRRWRERQKGSGYRWPFVFTAVLICIKGAWYIHTIHWSMPVD